MKQRIIESINDPDNLEKLFRQDKRDFEKCFSEISDNYDTSLVRFWKIRLATEMPKEILGFQRQDLFAVIVLSLFTAILVKIPWIFPGIDLDLFYLRNLPVIAFNGIILYSFWHNKVFDLKKVMLYGAALFAIVLYINLLPTETSDSVMITILHVPLLLWCFFGLTYVQFNYRNAGERMDFIRFNGELIIMTGLILLAGGLLTVITLGMFSVIKMDISKFYTEFIAIPGGVVAPIVSYFLIRSYPNITSKIGPVIARVFTPVVLITLAVYLISLIFSNSRILENRELLIIFNVMLLAVLAIIVFSISEIDKEKSRNKNILILFLLSVLAIVINSIALVAIISRVFDGLTPNRTVILITNVLVFFNLILIAGNLFRSYFKGVPLENIEKTVANYLTVYAGWTVIAVFILPLVFGFR
ncbi:MAG: DUF4153 domain-containing protein [Bacteroidia bacterium]|nr:DUF4153 domain-containing protein [Bacteroidia bacterium]